MKKTIDLILHNGKIYSLEEEGRHYEAMAVDQGKIISIGSNKQIAEKYEAKETLDLEGKTVLPGMGDSHLHFFAYCQTFTTVNLGDSKTKAEAIGLLSDKAHATEKGQWIKGSNFDQSCWADSDDRIPTRFDLDKVSTEHPIVIKRVCLHTAVANTKALEIAGIGKDFDYGPGGVVELDEDGMPNGILREQATRIFDELIPDPAKDPVIKKEIMEKALSETAAFGMTTVHTYAANIWRYTEDFDDYLNLDRAGELPLRVTIYLDELFNKPYLTKKEMEDPYRKVQYGGYKIFCDGALGSRSAKLYEPYEDDPTTDGILVQTQDQLNQKVLEGYGNNLQVAIHAIGDKGLDCVVTAIEYALKASAEKGMTAREQADKLPFRIIHAQMAPAELIERMAKLPVVLDIQPTFLCTDLHWIEERIGKQRAEYSYLWKTYVDKGLMLLGGSDSPVETFSPWVGIFAAAARQDMDYFPEGGYNPAERLSIYDSVCMYSKNIHYATGQEDYLGTLEPGKFADFVVIDDDIFEIELKDIPHIRPFATYLAGEKIFQR